MSSRAPAIGIDLGTTHSCVSVFRNGRVEVIANDMGSRTTPSVVAFTDEELMIGAAAVNQAARNLENTIYDVKRLIGRKFTDPKLQEDMRLWPFTVVKDKEQPKIQMSVNNQVKKFSPVWISSLILTKMRETAEVFIGQKVSSAVITVPAYFNDLQRKSTKDAGTIAGLNILRIINEPTAAAVAYGLDKSEKEQNLLVFDLGGGTFDVSIVTMKNGVQIVKATGGDTHLGGEDFDNRLVDHVLEQCKGRHQVDFTNNKRVTRRLRVECEKAKRLLSTNLYTDIEVVSGENEYVIRVSRSCFESLNDDLFRATIDCVRRTLQDANMDKKMIDEVILVGGSTRIPKVQHLLRDFFDGKELNQTINPDEAVAAGAAVHAAILNREEGAQMQLIDVAPLSLGISIGFDERMSVVIPRNTPIPAEKIGYFSNLVDNQVAVRFQVYEGESLSAKENNLLGEFTLHDVTPAPAATEKFNATFSIDADGILNVSAVDLRTGNRKEITIDNDGRLSKATIKRMAKDAEKYRLEDQNAVKRNAIKLELESYCANMSDFFSFCETISDADRNKVLDQCSGAVLWLKANSRAKSEEYARRLRELEDMCKPLIVKYNQESSAFYKEPRAYNGMSNLGNVD